MKVETQPVHKPFQALALRMLDLHEFIARGMIASEEADEIREDLDGLWEHLPDEGKELSGALSENLYHLFTPDEELKKEPDPADIFEKREVFQALAENLRKGRDPMERLKLLAKVPANIHPDTTFYQKACLFHQLEMFEIAIRFMRRAVALSADGGRGFILVDWVRRLKNPADAVKEFQRIRSSITEHQDFVELAYVMALIDLADLEHNEDHLAEAANLSERIFRKAMGSQGFPEIMVTHSALLYSSILDRKGEGGRAVEALRTAYKRAPGSQLIRIKLGVAIYDQKTDEAVRLFENLVRDQSLSLWPYLFLSHYYLSRGRWREAGNVAAQGVGLTDEPKIQADLLESCAISIAETGGDLELVRKIFDDALRLDPGNVRIRQNFRVLQEKADERPTSGLNITQRPSFMPNWQNESVLAV